MVDMRRCFKLSLVFAFFFLLLPSAFATQPSRNVNLVGKLAGGMPQSVFVKGNYAYVAANGILSIIDISDPSSPKEVGFYDTPGYVRGVYVLRKYAYVADGWQGLRIIDVSNPSLPKEVGFYDTPGDASGVYVLRKYAYVADSGSGLWILEFTGAPIPTPPDKVKLK